uniref:Uncharacterized protein n=1 Tax=Arundo donax TaxID=35708 RepID=A0A0A9Q5Q5_ARUDO
MVVAPNNPNSRQPNCVMRKLHSAVQTHFRRPRVKQA